MNRLSFALLFLFTGHCFTADSQSKAKTVSGSFPGNFSFIENIGQYDIADIPMLENMGQPFAAFEGFQGPVLFTKSGIIFLQRKVAPITHEKEEELEKAGVPEEEIEKRRNVLTDYVVLKWDGANSNTILKKIGKSNFYNTYYNLPGVAFSYNRMIFENLYSGIDLVLDIPSGNKKGFEYSFVVKPGADLRAIKLSVGNSRQATQKSDGSVVIASSIDTIFQSAPYSYTTSSGGIKDAITEKATGVQIESDINLNGNIISFSTGKYDTSKTLVIDPFITTASGFSGFNGQIAKDVDFDYAGNVYVSGGGEYFQHQISKFGPTGNLIWTFNGAVPAQSWAFGREYGGWAVDKNTGKVYVGQGFDGPTGIRVIRLDANGVYDNFISTPDPSFRECWKLVWNCSGGNPQILLCGGSTVSNVNFSFLNPPSTIITPINITGLPGNRQDIADIVIDPLNNDMYTIYTNANNTSGVDNNMFKHGFPYNSSTIGWRIPSGYNTLQEASNRPYLNTVTGSTNDNSINALAVNSTYLYYWDGTNLKAFSKSSGAGIGAPFTTAFPPKTQGGIYADECNNVYVGYPNGLIKVFRFNGSIFDDLAVADINITGFPGTFVYDLAYNPGEQLLYACGDGFVASFEVGANCPGNVYTITATVNCPALGITATLSPAPPIGSIVTYSVFNGPALVASNNTGVFTALTPGINYAVRAIINQDCNGAQATSVIVNLNSCTLISLAVTNSLCNNNSGLITASASFGTAPYTYSIDGVNFQSNNIFSGLASGSYTVTVKDAFNVTNAATAVVANTVATFNINAAIVPATCGLNNGGLNITVNGGTGPYQYSIDGINFQSSNIFANLPPAIYTIAIRDFNNCSGTQTATVNLIAPPIVSVISSNATCGLANGSITISVSNGIGPFVFSIDGTNFQPAGIFNSLAPGSYTATVRDASNCTVTQPVTLLAITPPVITSANTTAATCGINNGTISITSVNGNPPYQYSVDGVNFQVSPLFTGLAAGNYTVIVRDNSNCVATFNTAVLLISQPVINTATSPETCNDNNGSIIVNISGGSLPYSYSLDGINFQSGNQFNNLTATSYTVTIMDGSNCVATQTVQVPAAIPPDLNTAIIMPSCGLNNGSITCTVLNGQSPMAYSIDGINFQSSNTFNSLPPGTYTITVRDANNCIDTEVRTLAAIPLPVATATVTATDCFNNSGSITLNITGGSIPYSFSINGNTPQSTPVFNGLAAGTYTIVATDDRNCTTTASATVVINNNIMVSGGTDKEICDGSTVMLTATATNADQYEWIPAVGLSNSSILNPIAAPLITTAYTIKAIKGVCSREATVTVVVNQRPVADAGPDQIICSGSNFSLSGSGGISYNWSPSQYLNNTNIINPTGSNAVRSTTYQLVVTDDKGCVSATPDIITITVLPTAKINAGKDSMITVGSEVQLNALDVNNIGFTQFTWSPSTGLSNPFIQNPVASPLSSIIYRVSATTAQGCTGIDEVEIKVFKKADIYVPTAFTPDNNGLNDFAIAIPVGIRSFRFFRIFDRWGNMVFNTTDYTKGWDGKINGTMQGSNTYVWMAEAVDMKGATMFRKGTVTLIR